MFISFYYDISFLFIFILCFLENVKIICKLNETFHITVLPWLLFISFQIHFHTLNWGFSVFIPFHHTNKHTSASQSAHVYRKRTRINGNEKIMWPLFGRKEKFEKPYENTNLNRNKSVPPVTIPQLVSKHHAHFVINTMLVWIDNK